MDKTPNSNRPHITFLGETNSGKSSLFNKIIGVEKSIVSEISGTTTDTVISPMELIGFGAVVFVDTAGTNDKTELGEKRLEKTNQAIGKTNLAIICVDCNNCNNFNSETLKQTIDNLNSKKIKYIIVETKSDVQTNNINLIENSIKVSVNNEKSLNILKEKIIEILNNEEKEIPLISDLVEKNSVVVLVTPQDSEAPKGRLILPQAQLIRECVDNNIMAVVTNETNLVQTLANLKKIDLVVTDSKIFSYVNSIVPKEIRLTSFSILFARQKGDIKVFKEGLSTIKNLKDGDKIVIAENCVHNTSHEDIGKFKIPALLKNMTNKNLQFTFKTGSDFISETKKTNENYALIVHCGGCMATSKEMKNRIEIAQKRNIPIINYGMLFAFKENIIDRSLQNLFDKNI